MSPAATCSYRTGFFQVARCPQPATGACPSCQGAFCATHLVDAGGRTVCAHCAKSGTKDKAAAAMGVVGVGMYQGTLIDDFTDEDLEAMRRATAAEDLAERRERYES